MLKTTFAALSLSDQQKSTITPIIASRRQKLQTKTALMEDGDAKFKAILTPDQQQKYAQIEAQMRRQAKQHLQSQ